MATGAPTDKIDAGVGSGATLQLQNTEKRDTLIRIEKKYQTKWQEEGVFQVDAPSLDEIPYGSITDEKLREQVPKYFGTFAYPYMNGTLHVGHSFTISKVEFNAGFQRMIGKRTLFPLGFHCTGMPIKACADKLVDDVKKFGKNFERYEEVEEDVPEDEAPVAPTQGQTKEDITKFSGKKTKAAAKTVKAKYQFQIMLALGIPREEIHKFADANHWLEFFPPLCMQDLNDFGARIDWRRQFVTTDANPFYDSFIRWQMNRLHALNKIQYGNRYTIYSPKDGQPCMDHDRSEGEGIGPTEYTALKLKVKEWSETAEQAIEGKIPKDANVYFIPATLRPETMYGQTCCFVGPKISYGIFKASGNEYYVCTPRAAWNMAFQGTFFDAEQFPRDQSELQPVVEAVGSTFVGTLVNAPLSIHTDGIRILPMESVLATKGTGVVTSVPSDSPDDFATVRDLAKKAEYYGIKKEWAELEIIPIIETPTYGNLTAPKLVEQMKINSPKDATQLAAAKDLAYTEGFYKGKILVGEFAGQSVQEAKDKVKKSIIDGGDGFPFADPSGKVVSRSGDECVVAYLGQWFLNYGEQDPEWQKAALDWVTHGLNTYYPETANGFKANLEWLNRWACARTYGLGSKLPWDPKFLVESLSDSTIYMAYYTVAHLLHGDRYARTPGVLHIKPEQMTDEAWDCVFGNADVSEDVVKRSGISQESFEKMRREFEYWYPLDIRSSGKDLIPNHLTFFLYVHIALFPKKFWPRSVRANGHLLLNGSKMSKSTGNFLTLSEATKKFGADATRIALADGGDGIEDANFEEKSANGAILRLHTLKEWTEETKDKPLREGPADAYWDKLFIDEMNVLVTQTKEAYSRMEFKIALKSGLYDFQSARDFYREACSASGIPLHRETFTQYVTLQALLICPIAPHFAEYVWLEILKKPTSIQFAQWPSDTPEQNVAYTAAREYIKSTSSSITSAEAQAAKKMAKGKTSDFDPKKPKQLTIFVAKSYPSWQEKYIDLLRDSFDALTLSIRDEKALNSKIPKMGDKTEVKKAMPFVQGLKKRLQAKEDPKTVFDRKLAFDEVEALENLKAGLKRTTGCREIKIVPVGEDKGGLPSLAQSAVPSQPTFLFENIAE
ncbi:putative leucyl-trna synthetase [Phaeomoniella chlamydospora]|uniref:leucine--tRNA ligase n=1 Tax=Phaeomoniella chlamydospora TaxID=158046 RepID=A0A0G2EP54_PHACM|nr:putative leucyl-trna synthetase [Phaeomoniella chlamydospora]